MYLIFRITERMRGMDNEDLESSGEEVKQLEEFLKRSGFSSHSSDGDTGSEHDADIKLRSCVRRFLALKMNQDMAKMIDMADSQKKTVSFAVNGKPRFLDEKVNFTCTTSSIILSLISTNFLMKNPLSSADKYDGRQGALERERVRGYEHRIEASRLGRKEEDDMVSEQSGGCSAQILAQRAGAQSTGLQRQKRVLAARPQPALSCSLHRHVGWPEATSQFDVRSDSQ